MPPRGKPKEPTAALTKPLALAPTVLLQYQQKWLADKAKVRVYEKSRRVGISWSTASEAALTASAKREAGGMDVWYIGYVEKMAEEFIRDVAEWAKNFNLVAEQLQTEVLKEADKDILVLSVRFASGFRVSALSSAPRNLRGKQGYVIIDEAAFHDDLPGMLKAALALNLWGGRVAIISTHDGVDNPFNQLIEDCRAGRKKYSVHRTTIDEALVDGFYKRICLKSGEEWSAEKEISWRQERMEEYGDYANEELLVIPSNSGGAYLSRGSIEAQMYEAPVIRLELDETFAQQTEHAKYNFAESWCRENLAPLLAALPNLPHALGEDFGRVSDLSVMAPVTIEQKLHRRVPFLVELRNVPYKQQEHILFYIIDRLPRFQGAALDATGNGDYLAEQTGLRYGPRIIEVKLSEAWYSENLPPFKAAFEDGTFWIPKDLDVVSDLRALQVIGGVPKLPKTRQQQKGAKGKQRHGDSAVALALADFASRSDVEEYDYHRVSASASRVSDDDDGDTRQVQLTGGIRNLRGGIW
jgi:phage FluMu gp28-like protein